MVCFVSFSSRSLLLTLFPLEVACAVTFGVELMPSPEEEGLSLLRFQHQTGDKLTFHWLIRERLSSLLSL